VLRDDPLRFFGKTGTAQWLKEGGQEHAWFVGSTGYGTPGPKLSFAVLVLRGGHGGSAAAPLAAKVLRHVTR
jgi:cell division protein FtsI/penicillin-binding protein 2